jgi:hypothetical protein
MSEYTRAFSEVSALLNAGVARAAARSRPPHSIMGSTDEQTRMLEIARQRSQKVGHGDPGGQH